MASSFMRPAVMIKNELPECDSHLFNEKLHLAGCSDIVEIKGPKRISDVYPATWRRAVWLRIYR